MCNRKYREYLIKIEHQNGDTETIEYSDERKLNSGNYKEMLSVYRETKEQYEGTPCTILFMGNNGEEFVEMFSKTLKLETEHCNHNQALDDLKTIDSLMSNIINSFENSSDLLSLAEKKINEFYHKVESNIFNDLSDKNKINRYDELTELLKHRRECSDNVKIMRRNKDIFSSMAKNHKEIENILEYRIENQLKCSKEINNEDGKAYESNSVKTYSYKNFKDKINLTKQLLPKYDKVIDDEQNMQLCCYVKLYNKK